MRDLLIDFGDGRIRTLSELNDTEFAVINHPIARQALIVEHSLPGQNVPMRLDIEALIRSKKWNS